MSVAVAQPTITINSQAGQDKSSEAGIGWNGISSTDVYQPVFQESGSPSNTPIENLIFKFGGKETNKSFTFTKNGTTNTVTAQGGVNAITLNADGKGLQFGTFRLNFNDNSLSRTFDFNNLRGVTLTSGNPPTNNNDFSIKGNLEFLRAGNVNFKLQDSSANKAIYIKGNISVKPENANDGQGIKGNIQFKFHHDAFIDGNVSVGEHNYGERFFSSTLTATGDLTVKGTFFTKKGGATINLTKANANLKIGTLKADFYGKNNITFEQKGTFEVGDIISKTGTNILDFKQGGKIVGNFTTEFGYANKGGINIAKLGSISGSGEIEGNITTNWGDNQITFGKEGSTQVKHKIEGNIFSGVGARNEVTNNFITFLGEGSAAIKQGGLTPSNITGREHQGIEAITGKNQILFKNKGAQTIEGNIIVNKNAYVANRARNEITFTNTSTITGKISAVNGINTISGTQITITQNNSPVIESSGGKNIITASLSNQTNRGIRDNSSSITINGNNTTVLAIGGSNTFEADSITISGSNAKALHSYGNGTNQLTADTITITGEINSDTTGNNGGNNLLDFKTKTTITGNITGVNGRNRIQALDSADSTNFANNSTLTITGTITADAQNGRNMSNTFTAEKINVSGVITTGRSSNNTNGTNTNTFTFKEGIFQGDITTGTQTGGTNKNIFNITSSNSKMGKDNTSSEITFKGSNGTHIINLAKDNAQLSLMKTNAQKTSFANTVRGDGSNLVGLTNDNSKTEINFNGTGTKLALTTLKTTGTGTTTINVADGVNANITGGITTDNGATTHIIFGADSTPSENAEETNQAKPTILALGKVDSTGSSITNIKFANSGNSTDNTLDLTGVSKLSVTEKVSVGGTQTQDLTIALKDTELALNNGLDTNEKGTTTLRVENTTNGATLSNNGASENASISLTNLDFVVTDARTSNNPKLTIKASDVKVVTLTAQEGTPTLVLDSTSNAVVTTIQNEIEGEVLSVEFKGASNATILNLNGGILKSLNVTGTNNNLTLQSGVTTITEALSVTREGKGINLDVKSGATLALGGTTNTITTLTGANGSRVDLARVQDDGSTPLEPRSGNYKTLTIGAGVGTGVGARVTDARADATAGFKGETEFEVYVGADKQADKVEFNSATKQNGEKESIATITASGDKNTIKNGNGTILLATVKSTAKENMIVQGGTKRFGALDVTTILTEKAKGDKVEYYLGKGIVQVDNSFQDIASTALIVNYDLYIANFNSLNKRMGELRDNPHSQGVWTRVFGGAMSSDYGSGSQTNYLTTQAGYDYSFGFSGARNYLGVALAYGKSWTKGNTLQANNFNGTTSAISLSSVNSSLVEVGVYNSYVSDSGWYNDTILKFDYIMSKFSLSDDTALKTKTNNFAVVLSNEVGYRYEFGGSKDWYVDPQLELAFGYFNQSNFNRMIEGDNLLGTQDTILTLRSRIGSALGKRFEGKRGSASLYVGAFYEFDYIVGGNASAGTTDVLNSLSSKLVSNGRAVINVGSNIALGEATRVYIDVEKSFGEEQRTFMQFNAGVRYSFGESHGYTSKENKNTSAPLKIEKK